MCDDRERLLGYLYNECDDDERRRVEQHLETCETCPEELAGLRATRQDLLAWDVPEHGSVWKPFVSARMAPRWRDVPAWAMVAAASLMFVVGSAGGIVTHAMLERRGAVPAEQVAAKTPAVQPAPARVAAAELSAMEQRMLSDMRSELAAMQRASARNATATGATIGTHDVADRINVSEQRQFDMVTSLNNDFMKYKRRTDQQFDAITQKLELLSSLISQQAGR